MFRCLLPKKYDNKLREVFIKKADNQPRAKFGTFGEGIEAFVAVA
jgi:hypothetical protein